MDYLETSRSQRRVDKEGDGHGWNFGSLNASVRKEGYEIIICCSSDSGDKSLEYCVNQV